MLWLAGLMGLMAVGTVAFVDPQNAGDDDEDGFDTVSSTPRADDSATGATSDAAPDQSAEDPFEPDYDPRGGDDAAILPAFVLSEAYQVTLSEGTEEDDQLDGTDGNDRMRGLEGDDALGGGTGNDELRGESGDDTLDGDAGADTLHGNDGVDLMHGDSGNDELFGHNGNDNIFGDDGDDLLQGSAGNDLLDGGEGDDTLQGGLDDDTLIGGAGVDVLFGGWGNDVISGIHSDRAGHDDNASDFLNGGGGDDSILAGSGDIITAGEGADEIVLGDWITEGDAAHITDYAVEDDSIVLVWDDTAAGTVEPRISVTADPDRFDQTLVLMDGAVIATVNGTGLLPGDIALIPLSTATQVGLGVN